MILSILAMIRKSEVQMAIEGARSALEEESGLSWIRRSALLERAYHFGLLFGLSKIANEKDLNTLTMRVVMDTWGERGADDSFGETRIGKAYDTVKSTVGQGLKDGLRADPKASTHKVAELSTDNFQVLKSLVKEFQSHMHRTAEHIDELVERIVSDVNVPEGISVEAMEEKMKLLSALEEPLRVIALLETDHKLSNRLGG